MAAQIVNTNGLWIAVEGCGHGTLNAIYSSVEKTCQVNGWPGIDLLIIGGDFQAVRNAKDLNCMSVPVKYREIGDFYEYYSGARSAPYLTLFIGGNHEASNYLQELYYGGWVAPKIYYLGAANVLRLGPLRIAGLSGIWKGYNYNKPHHERLPYNQDDVKSIYHVREIDVRKLLQIRTQVDIGLSHDWPRAVEWNGNHKKLFRQKDLFEAESKAGTLGSTAAKYVLDRLRPAYWFAAHLHVKFSALVRHGGGDQKQTSGSENIDQPLDTVTSNEEVDESSHPSYVRNTDEIELDMDDELDESPLPHNGASSIPLPEVTLDGVVPATLREQLPASFARPMSHNASHKTTQTVVPPDITNKETQFLALDKCLPGRKFLQVVYVEPMNLQPDSVQPQQAEVGEHRLEYDKEWLAITRAFARELDIGDRTVPTPSHAGESQYLRRIEAEEEWVEEHVVSQGKMVVPDNFATTAPVYDPALGLRDMEMPVEYNNPQMMQYCEMLEIENKFFATDEERAERIRRGPAAEQPQFGGSRGGHRGGGHPRGGRGHGRFRGRGRGRGSR